MKLDMGNLLELVIAAITFWGISWGFHRQDKKDRDDKAKTVQVELTRAAESFEEKQDERHRENQEKMREMSTRLTYYPPHLHIEGAGPLNSEGIRYVPRRGD